MRRSFTCVGQKAHYFMVSTINTTSGDITGGARKA
jgi:hypothetical protein